MIESIYYKQHYRPINLMRETSVPWLIAVWCMSHQVCWTLRRLLHLLDDRDWTSTFEDVPPLTLSSQLLTPYWLIGCRGPSNRTENWGRHRDTIIIYQGRVRYVCYHVQSGYDHVVLEYRTATGLLHVVETMATIKLVALLWKSYENKTSNTYTAIV